MSLKDRKHTPKPYGELDLNDSGRRLLVYYPYNAGLNVEPTPEPTPTPSVTASVTPTFTPTQTITPSVSPTFTPTPSATLPPPGPSSDMFVFSVDTSKSGGDTNSAGFNLFTNQNYGTSKIHWGDGDVYTFSGTNTLSEITHVYPDADVYDIWIETIGAFYGMNIQNDAKYDQKVIEMKQWGTGMSSWKNIFGLFQGCQNLTGVTATDIPNFTNIQTAAYMFLGCNKLDVINRFEDFDIAFNQGQPKYIGAFLSSAFSSAGRLTELPKVEGWDMTNVVDIGGFFENITSSAMASLDLSGWDVSNIANLQQLFTNTNFNNNSLNNWDVSSNETLSGTFQNTSFNQDISGWDTSNVVNFGSIFRGNDAFNHDISGWDTSKGTNFFGVFFGGGNNYSYSLSGWTFTGALTSFFRNSLYSADPLMDVSSVTNMSYMFYDSDNLYQGGAFVNNWDVSSVTAGFNSMFRNSSNLDFNLTGWTLNSGLSTLAFNDFLAGTSLPTARYDELLVWLDGQITAQSLIGAYAFNGGSSNYTLGSAAETARTNILANGWVLTDGGGV